MFTDLHRIPEQLPGEPSRRQSASAIALGIAFGLALIRSRRRPLPSPMDAVSLHLDA